MKKVPLFILFGFVGFTQPFMTELCSEDKAPEKTAAVRLRATDLKTFPVTDSAGMRLGSISDLMIGVNGTIPWIICSFDGFTGTFPLPSRLLRWTLPLGRGFAYHGDPAKLLSTLFMTPDTGDGSAADKAAAAEVRWNGEAGTATERILPASRFLDTGLRLGNGTARVENLMIDPIDWTIAYVAVTRTGTPGTGNGSVLYAVPFGRFGFPRPDSAMTLDISERMLQRTKGFDQLDWPADADPLLSVSVK